MAFSTAACAQSSYQLIKVLDGALGEGALIEGSDGKLYGMIARGGGKGEGMVFKLNKDGNGCSALYSFVGILTGGSDGSGPTGLAGGKGWRALWDDPDTVAGTAVLWIRSACSPQVMARFFG